MGRETKRVDLAVHRSSEAHKQENVLLYVECKRDDKPLKEKDSEEQLKSYMAASNSCRFGIFVAKERWAFEKLPNGRFERIPDIPRSGQTAPKRPARPDLVLTHELSSVFKRCHNYIYVNEGLQKADAFHELIKLIFCKTYDEEESGEELMFGVDPKERMSESGQRLLMQERIGPLFDKVRGRYSYIFDKDDVIDLNPRVVAYVVSELQYLSLLNTDIDVKGSAYEELVGSNLRGDRGEFFTPRNVCNMAVQMVMSLHKSENLTSLKVIDCCCGTGGFLVSWLTQLHQALLNQERKRADVTSISEERARSRVREVCTRNMFGLDINPRLVQACQMNLVLHGDGSSNIFRADSVRTPGEWDSKPRQDVPFGKADVVFTNPPFGGKGKIDDRHVLGQFELPGWKSDKRLRSSLPAEQLFVEAAMRFVKPGGYLVIVLPNGIVNNPGLSFIRSWILQRSQVVASVGLPKTTFAASKGIKNSTVLILRKFNQDELKRVNSGRKPNPYKVFMTQPETAGINSRNKPIYLAQPNGMEIIDGAGRKVLDDQIRGVVDAIKEWQSRESTE